jgi:uncharacterized protein YutE (UPF0331/DUF86 family)
MDRRLIDERLESLRRCVERIRSRCPEDSSDLLSDPDLQDIVTLNLTRAVQICVDIAAVVISDSSLPPPDTMGAAFDALAELAVLDGDLAIRMKVAVGFRNIAVHSYQSIDWEIVHRLCRENLDDFRRYAAAVEQASEGE